MAFDIPALRSSGQFILLDAEETVSRFLVDGWPDNDRFSEVIEQNLRHARGSEGREGPAPLVRWSGCFGIWAIIQRRSSWSISGARSAARKSFRCFAPIRETASRPARITAWPMFSRTHSKVLVA